MFNTMKKLTCLGLALCLASLASCANAADVSYVHKSQVGTALRLPIHEWSTPGETPKGIIVANQGLVFSGKAYDAIARHLVEKGYFVYAPDFRGFGDWLKDAKDFDGDPAVHFTETKNDLTRLLKHLGTTFPNTPIFLMGESFGANYSIWEASTEPYLMDGVIGISPCFQLRVHPRALWFLTFAQGLRHPKKPLDVAPYLEPILSDKQKLTEECLNDPEVCTKLSATDLVKALITNRYTLEHLEHIPRDLPMLLVAGEKDEIQNPQKIKASLPRIGSEKVTMVVFPKRGHLLLEHQQVDPQLAATIDEWLAKNSIRKVASAPSPGSRTQQP
jgi:acylglycerol lipase